MTRVSVKSILRRLESVREKTAMSEKSGDYKDGIGRRENVIISCVGQRPLAVIVPIKSLIMRKGFTLEDTSIRLMYTEKTKGKAEECQKWFEEAFQRINVKIDPFNNQDLGSFMESIEKTAKEIYFNSDPGMNWQVAKVTMHLPRNARLMYADFQNLYIWPVDRDIKDAEKIELTDIGFELYNRFSEKRFIKKEGVNEGIHDEIRALLVEHNYNAHFEVEYKKQPQDKIKEFIRDRLVWVKERYGMVYLLFDFIKRTSQKDGQNEEDQGPSNLDMYRAVTDIFDPLNFIIAIITDDFFLKERSRIDGVYFIYVGGKDNESWKKNVLSWIREKWVLPKGRVPQQQTENLSDKERITGIESCLFVSLGDNIETTLKAIRYHGLKDVFVFYDRKAYRIWLAAKRVKEGLKDVNIRLLPTDNRGSGIMNNIRKRSQGIKDIHINISPGTKSQAVAMVQGARSIGRLDSLFSIERNVDMVKNLLDDSKTLKKHDLHVMDLINCNIARFKESLPIHEDPVYLAIMQGLSNNTIKRGSHILELKNNKGQSIFNKVPDGEEGDTFILECTLDGRKHRFHKDFLDPDKGGIWWEAAVAYALKINLTDNILWSVRWGWSEKHEGQKGDLFFSEIDVVFPFEDLICAVSCKSGKRGLEEMVRYQIKSEAQKRFGRFALSFIAVPFDRYKGEEYKGRIIDDVMYLTPSLLLNSEELKKGIKDFAESKRTTSNKWKE
jgi:hypothetical protein